MENMIMEVVTTLAVAIVTGAVTLLVAFMQSKIKNERINLSLDRLETASNATAAALQQDVVERWKKDGGGKLTKTQVEQLKSLAMERVKALIDDPAAELLGSVGVDLEGLIEALVEKAVVHLKERQ